MVNWLTDFIYHAGTSEIPKAYVKWVGLAALAACAGDRLYTKKGLSPVYPNLYTFLIGPSGLGKGEAIATGLRLLKDCPQVYTVYGRITAAAMIDVLCAKPGAPSRHTSKMFLATPELSMAVGRGTVADDLVKLMTELYTCQDYAPIVERTRTSGRHVIRGHCLNWIAGTTKEWLRDCVTREAVEGGFFARVACIQATYDLSHRLPNPLLPLDYGETRERLLAHLEGVLTISGPVVFDPRAQDLHDRWYMERPEPADESLLPSWKREDDFVRKLATLLALCEPHLNPVILPKHVVEAQRLTAETARQLPSVIEYIGADMEADGMRRLREVIRAAGAIHQTSLARHMTRYGVTHDKLRLFLDTLLEAKLVRREDSGRGGKNYVWNGRRHVRGGAE